MTMWKFKGWGRNRPVKGVDAPVMEELHAVSEQELLQVEGGRARVGNMLDEDTRRLPTGEVRVELPPY